MSTKLFFASIWWVWRKKLQEDSWRKRGGKRVLLFFFFPLPISSLVSWTLVKKSFSTPSTSSWQWQAAYFSKRFLFKSRNAFPHLNFLRRRVARSGNPLTENKLSVYFSVRFHSAYWFLSLAPTYILLQEWDVCQHFFSIQGFQFLKILMFVFFFF